MTPVLVLAAAPAGPVQGFGGGQLFGAIGLSGIALCISFCFVVGLRGSDKIKINNKDRALGWGIATGSVWMAAGGMWTDMGNGISNVSRGIFGQGSGFGDPGLGGLALFLTLCAWAPRWKRMAYPGVFALAAGIIYGQAGGVFGIVVNVIRMLVGIITGGSA